MSYRVAIIAALEREVAPLVKGWRVLDDGVPAVYRKYAKGDTVVVCAGMGIRAARHSAEGVLYRYKPELLVSAGLAGALIRELQIGQAIVPSTIISAATGKRYVTGHGRGVLVTASGIVGLEAKRLLARQYSAELVDMEAAAVAEVAEDHGIAFTAVKAISDEAEFDLPDMDPFVDPRGRFLTGKFASHVALRPRLWGVVRKLAAHSARASMELCTSLQNLIEEGKQEPGLTNGRSVFQGKECRSR